MKSTRNKKLNLKECWEAALKTVRKSEKDLIITSKSLLPFQVMMRLTVSKTMLGALIGNLTPLRWNDDSIGNS